MSIFMKKSIENHSWTFSQLFPTTVEIQTFLEEIDSKDITDCSSTTIRLDVSIQNRYPVDVHVDNMKFYFHQKQKQKKQKGKEEKEEDIVRQVMEQLMDQVDTCFVIEKKNIVLSKSQHTTHFFCVNNNKVSNGQYQCTKMECTLYGQTITLTTQKKLFVDIFSKQQPSFTNVQLKMDTFVQTPTLLLPSDTKDVSIVQLQLIVASPLPSPSTSTSSSFSSTSSNVPPFLQNVQVDICINNTNDDDDDDDDDVDVDKEKPLFNRIEPKDHSSSDLFEIIEQTPYKMSIQVSTLKMKEISWNVYVNTKSAGIFSINSVFTAQEIDVDDDENEKKLMIKVDKCFTVVQLLTIKEVVLQQQMDIDKIFISVCLELKKKNCQRKGIVLKKYDWLLSNNNQLIVEQDPNGHLMNTIIQSNEKVFLAFVLTRQPKKNNHPFVKEHHVLQVYYEMDGIPTVQYCLPVEIPLNKLNQRSFHVDMSIVTEPTIEKDELDADRKKKWIIGALIQFEIIIKCFPPLSVEEKEKDNTLIEVSLLGTNRVDWIIVGPKSECLQKVQAENDGRIVFFQTMVPCRMGLLFYPNVSLKLNGQLIQKENVYQAQRGRQIQIDAAVF
jgi:hypothetical protein